MAAWFGVWEQPKVVVAPPIRMVSPACLLLLQSVPLEPHHSVSPTSPDSAGSSKQINLNLEKSV